MKKVIVLTVCLFLMSLTFGQTAVIQTVSGFQGSTVAVPVIVKEWHNIEAITLHIEFDPQALTYTGCDLVLPEMLSFCFNGMIGLAWCDLTPVTLSGKLAVFYFTVNGSSTINFVPICEVIEHPYIPVNVNYWNGGVVATQRRLDEL